MKATTFGLVLCALMTGCSGYFKGAPQSTMTKTPMILGQDADGTLQWGEIFHSEFDGQAAEMLYWDNLNKNLMISSSKDESLDGLTMQMSFDGTTGQMTGVDLTIDSKSALASPATLEAWKGRVASLEAAYGPEGVKGILSAIKDLVPAEILDAYGIK